jgi:beta-galactosidase/beta-glucuronidase
MNYNINYTVLPQDTQLKLHRRDFQIMRDAGVNAIIGWGIYDEITLQVAEEYGIGVIMPFELEPSGAFDNEDYRNQVKSNFREYIKRFRDCPAVWGWNPGGDELLYRMKTEEQRTVDKIQIAADFELELVALAHSLDPNHINVIKEPRDWYIKYLSAALQKLKTQPDYQDLSTNLIYGVNVYGHFDDIELALTNAQLTLTDQLGLAMLVTEFGPFNSLRADRPADYAGIWDVVNRISTIGGLVYVFGPDQPNPSVANPYDPLTLLPSEYSLVDMNGVPLDNSLAALAAKWHAP